MNNLTHKSNQFKTPMSKDAMKKVKGGEGPACIGVQCPPGTSLVVNRIGEGTYVCTCQCGDTSYCL